MGTPVPPDFPEFIDGKYYCIYVDLYKETWPDLGCDGPYECRRKCCRTGEVIKAFYQSDFECKLYGGIIIPSWPGPQRIVACHGPYDTGEDCEAACSS